MNGNARSRSREPKPPINASLLLEDLDNLGQIGANANGGIDRTAFSQADLEARRWVESRMKNLGMSVRIDPAGNSIGTYQGHKSGLYPIALGSHTDTVPNGGRYDGALGVMAAIACVRALRDAGIQLDHPIEVINFAGEEATMAGGLFGSQAMNGSLDLTRFNREAWDGRSVLTHLQSAGLDPGSIMLASRPKGSLAAYLELHIEQGGVLEESRVQIGVVKGIVGIRRYNVTFHGHANHAGTTPMNLRRDALVMAAEFILAVRDLAVSHHIVGTVGTARVSPGAPAVIPGQVDLSLEIRALHHKDLEEAQSALAGYANEHRANFDLIRSIEPVDSDPLLLEALIEGCHELELPYKMMSSGAGHDAMAIASMAPQAMLFVPSRGGISHSPNEFTDTESCIKGAQVLLRALLNLDSKF